MIQQDKTGLILIKDALGRQLSRELAPVLAGVVTILVIKYGKIRRSCQAGLCESSAQG